MFTTLLSPALVLALGATPFDAAADAIAHDGLRAYHAPGLAIVIVRDDTVIYLKGHGVRERGKPEAVTPDTIFAIGSVTKAFTATVIAQLVDDGKADWDDPVRKHLPWFRLADPLADRDVTLRDLLCHRTGLGPHDLLWYRAAWPVEESVRRLAFLEPARSFRSGYEYNNLCYLAAGLAAAETSKMPWQELVRKRLLEPLGMDGTVFTSGHARKAADHATPHWRNRAGTVEPVAWYPDDRQIRASGSIKTSARALARWLRFQLNGGVLDGKRLVSEAALAETHQPQVVFTEGRPGATQVGYGLGWRILDYRRQPVVEHGGAVDGFRAQVVLLPKQKAGLAVLTNFDETALASDTAYALVDVLLGVPAKQRRRFVSVKPRSPGASRTIAGPRGKPSREATAYAGSYAERAYGPVRVIADGDMLTLQWSSFTVPLRHVRFDTYAVPEEVPFESRRVGGVEARFSLGSDGDVATLRFLGRTFTRER
jgi:CubicO group peptidase (beta-lactamase class C family)